MRDTLLFGSTGREYLPAKFRKSFRILTVRMGPGREPDFNTWTDGFRRLLGPRWDAHSFDLLNVMCALRAADRYFGDQGMFCSRRKILLAVHVTNASRWRRLAQPLSKAVSALSNDVLEFYPLQMRIIPGIAMPGDSQPELKLPEGGQPDCVCLFSGGADSFAGAAYLLSRGRRPLFISHSVGPVSGLQKRLFNDLIERFKWLGPQYLVQLRPQPNTTRAFARHRGKCLYWKPREGLQRLRSAFFFSIAGIFARALGLDEIFMCENGLVAAAIVFAPIDDSSYTTRPAEPHFLRAMESFLQQVFDMPSLSIRNPFQYMTKGEVLADAAKLGLAESLFRTVSCWRSGNRGLRNCGQCVPCLFRQLAFSEAKLPPALGHNRYLVPIPQRRWRRWRSKELGRLEDIREYCRMAVKRGLPFLMAHELSAVDAIDATGGPVYCRKPNDRQKLDEKAPKKTADVILRFARATLQRLQ